MYSNVFSNENISEFFYDFKQFNYITRIIISIFFIILSIDTFMSFIFLIFSLLFIIIVYYIKKKIAINKMIKSPILTVSNPNFNQVNTHVNLNKNTRLNAVNLNTLNNNIKEHFITRIRRFMNVFAPIDLSIDENKKIFNIVKNLILLDTIDEIPDEIKEWSKWIRNNFLPIEYEKLFGYDCKVNPSKYFYYTIKMNEEIENKNLNCNDKIKLFQPIPLRNSIIPHYITLDANGVLSIFGDEGESRLGHKINENNQHHTRTYINSTKWVGCNRKNYLGLSS